MAKITEMLCDCSGHLSTMRILSAFVVVIILLTWCGVCVFTGKFVDIGLTNAGVIASALAAKGYQRKQEKQKL